MLTGIFSIALLSSVMAIEHERKDIFQFTGRPRSCEDIQMMGIKTSGIYRIFPGNLIEDSDNGIEAYCDLETDRGGWTLFLRQAEAVDCMQVNFDRNWNEYVNGFGRLQDSFWLGLENILKLTMSGGTELRVDLEDWDGEKRYAKYDTFQVGCSKENYTLKISGYTGNAGDSLSKHDGLQFTPQDRDNDNRKTNCALTNSAGWWYNSCYWALLTGRYSTDPNQKGVTWLAWHGKNYSLKGAEMKVRSVNFMEKLKRKLTLENEV